MWPPQLLTLPHSPPSHLFSLNLEITSFLGGCSFPIETTLCCMASLGIRVFFWLCGWHTKAHTINRTWLSLSQVLSSDNRSSASGIVCGHFPCFMLGFFLLQELQLVFSMLSYLQRVHMSTCPAVSGKLCWLEVIHHFWLLSSLLLSSKKIPEPLRSVIWYPILKRKYEEEQHTLKHFDESIRKSTMVETS